MPNHLVIIRHGQTEWTKKFTGWTDIDLAPEGINKAKEYALKLKEKKIKFHIGFTSVLKRGHRTLDIFLEILGQKNIKVVRDWHLNERHYGALQGLSKLEVVEKHGEEQVKIWRRSYHIPPPKLSFFDRRHPRFDPLYKDIPPEKLPVSESLKDTYNRVIPFFKKEIEPLLRKGKNVILSGHSNSIRAIIKYIDKLSDEEITRVDIPYCIPLIYEWEMMMIKKKYYLASDSELKEAIESVKKQIKK